MSFLFDRYTMPDAPLKPWLQQEPPAATIFEQERVRAEENTVQTDEARLRAEQLEELMLTDPAEYERLVLRDEITEEEASQHG